MLNELLQAEAKDWNTRAARTFTEDEVERLRKAVDKAEYHIWHVITNMGKPDEAKKDAIEAHKLLKQTLEATKPKENDVEVLTIKVPVPVPEIKRYSRWQVFKALFSKDVQFTTCEALQIQLKTEVERSTKSMADKAKQKLEE